MRSAQRAQQSIGVEMNCAVPARLVRALQRLGRERLIAGIGARQHAMQLTDASAERVHLRGEQRVRRIGDLRASCVENIVVA